MTYKSKFANADIDLLFDAILLLKEKDECYRFFEDLCTINELQEMGQRIKVAKMLHAKIPYQMIESETHASSATISRVNKSLLYGADGYHYILKKLETK
ncbi:MAG: TrpR-like protein YerC/YecD [Firmicutes bacterium]|nr:TrpR-like protein YerC/YecD [Bacillota bacterium]